MSVVPLRQWHMQLMMLTKGNCQAAFILDKLHSSNMSPKNADCSLVQIHYMQNSLNHFDSDVHHEQVPSFALPDTKLQMLHRHQSFVSCPFVVSESSSSRLQLKPSINHRGISST